MKPEELLALVNAGFTKDEIMTMFAPAAPTAPAAPAAPAPDPTPAAPAPDPTQAAIASLTDQVSQLAQIVQKSNLLSLQQPTPQPASAEDILATIIFPTYKPDNK